MLFQMRCARTLENIIQGSFRSKFIPTNFQKNRVPPLRLFWNLEYSAKTSPKWILEEMYDKNREKQETLIVYRVAKSRRPTLET